MLCEICQLREATVKFTQIINEKKEQLNLCKNCAEEKGFTNPLGSLPQIFGGLIIGLLAEGLQQAQVKDSSAKCTSCGQTLQIFKKTGLLGCADCYGVFDAELKVMLRRIHGSNKHIGGRPTARRLQVLVPDLEKLRRQLALAVKNEKYEEAARLRDLIHDSEKVMNRATPGGGHQ